MFLIASVWDAEMKSFLHDHDHTLLWIDHLGSLQQGRTAASRIDATASHNKIVLGVHHSCLQNSKTHEKHVKIKGGEVFVTVELIQLTLPWN